jgi:phenylacetate-coenzyme A ligase PaaK-like adenylate-forming protein
MATDPLIPISSMPQVVWPAVPSGAAAITLSLLFQLEQTQWWSPQRLREHQFTQLRLLVRHAARHVPYYRRRWAELGFDAGADGLSSAWPGLPVLTRAQLQEAGDELNSRAVPPAHGPLHRMASSGSTGRPVAIQRTGLAGRLWLVATLRDHLWHRRDLSGKLVSIRANLKGMPEEGYEHPNWGSTTAGLFPTGPGAGMYVGVDIARQRRFLIQQNPDYLMTHASNARGLALSFLAEGGQLPRLKQVRTYSEALPPDLRDLCRRAWGARVVDAYSAEEAGYIALQCPDHEHYHVQAETILVEVLDEAGRACGPGEVGRVVVTPLHNFATPLVRYELGDYAQVGPPCPCGRGLPVLARILGRQRNMLVLPDGRRQWPSFPVSVWADIGAIRQLQLIQHTPQRIEARLAVRRPMTDAERQEFIRRMQERFGYPFDFELTFVDELERSAIGKFEDFVSRIEG